MASVFTKIIDGEFPGHFVWRDDVAVAFLSINPIRRGHTLVVPRAEVDHWLDLPPDTNAHLLSLAQRIGVVQQRLLSPARVGLMIAGFEVPHTHLHVIAIDSMADLDFANAAHDVDHADLAALAHEFSEALAP